jgi:hypothetical protein
MCAPQSDGLAGFLRSVGAAGLKMTNIEIVVTGGTVTIKAASLEAAARATE